MTRIFCILSFVYVGLFYQFRHSPHYHYLTYLPEKYDSTRNKKWPLIIYLHGKSACGNDLKKVSSYGLPFFTDHGMQLDAIAVSPQCPTGKNWTTDDWLLPFLEEVTQKYHIDTTRIYLTGMSLGGFGTWDLAIKYPHKFAAIVPLCGGGRPQTVCAIKDVPIWVIHGDQDEQVSVSRSKEMIEALRKCGGDPKFTILKGYPHDIHRTYGDENLYKWMMQFKLNSKIGSNDKEITLHDYLGKKSSRVAINKDEVEDKDKVEDKVEVKKKAKVKDDVPNRSEVKVRKKRESRAIAKAQFQKDREIKSSKQKVSSITQTDTIKGKDFMLVF